MHRVRFWHGLAVLLVSMAGIAAFQRYRAHAPPSPEAVRHTQRAAVAVAARDFSAAKVELAATRSLSPEYAPALLLGACIALEEKNAREAEEAIARLQAVVPEHMETRFLEKLLAHRQRTPQAGWKQSFVDAWAELGRPDFKDSALLPEFEAPEMDEQAWQRASTPSARLAVSLASSPLSEEQARCALQQVPLLEAPVLVLAVARKLDDEAVPTALRVEGASIIQQRLTSLATAQPRSMQLRLWLLLALTPPEAAFSEEDFQRLEDVASLPLWREDSFAQAFDELRATLRRAGVPNAGDRAFSVVSSAMTGRGLRVLSQRAAATRSQLLPGARQRLGRILWNIGSRVAEQSSLVERVTGLQLMARGSEDMRDDEKRQHADKRMDEVLDAIAAARSAAPERWPLPSLWEELLEEGAHDELGSLQAFVGPGTPTQEDLKKEVLPLLPEECPPLRKRHPPP